MGSEHYCLRWNNHQSNLLGVFSQLLQDESLVDVTLACSEGASIRAHKVVLSACSSYFQSLFLEHPSRHPIVILKDVRFSELRTLVEFMYKGEVNVEYCQLSALLKTAESLKVKGLAEMTNLNATTQENDRDQENMSSRSQQHDMMSRHDTPTRHDRKHNNTATSTATSESQESVNKRLAPPEESDTPPPRLAMSPNTINPLNPLALPLHCRGMRGRPEPMDPGPDEGPGGGDGHRASSPEDDTVPHRSNCGPSEMGLNMSINANINNASTASSGAATSTATTAGDLRLIQMSSSATSTVIVPSTSRLNSPMAEPIAGPSGLPPVQQVPLSLKKEVDWDRGDDKSSGGSPLEYRHSHDPMDQEAGFSGSLCADRPSSPLSSRSSTPFHFPFPPLASALFDNDAPNRLLSLLQHQSMLTEESLRCRALLDESRGLYLLGKDGFKLNHFLADDMMKRKNIFGEGAFGCRSLREEELRCQSLFSKEARDDRCKNLDETVRCGVCFATFPSAWLLEQHTTLQHLPLGQLPDDKPFICEQCGQSYRYRSAYVKHREQNHRARLPADKLFTCDVCGMQFRYLKSFKKHRLNHALERLHGKSDMFATERTDPSARMLYMMRAGMSSKSTATVQTVTENSSDQVSSSNEAIQSEVDLTTSKDKHDMDAKDIESGPSEVITDRISECDQDDTIDSISFEAHNAKEAPVETKSKSVSKADSSISDNTQETTILRKILRPSSEDGVENNETSCSNKLADSSIEQRPHDSLLSNMLLSDSNNAVTEAMRSAPEASLMNLNVQEASILNFLRVDAAERQRERRFACPFCGKCVRSKENLKLHVRKHTGERPFVCLFCGRAFGGKSDLTRHLRIHTGERPYHCEACGKCFARADYLSKHLTTHIHNTPR